ncbi:MAG: YlxQ family RNA-binding protein [Bacillaceae bacterium]|nr:YlxQ family RNA-binding protein [Bacillaceae bacterium]
MNSKYLNMLGLAFRAGKCTIGEEAIVKKIQQNKVKLLLIASDASANTVKKLTDKCNFYQVPYFVVDDRATLSQSIGKFGRVAVAINDKGFADKIASLLDESYRG